MEPQNSSFVQWLADRDTSGELARRYEYWLSAAKPGWPLDFAVKNGLCPPMQATLTQLSAGQLYPIYRQSEGAMAPKYRTALNMCLHWRTEAELRPLGLAPPNAVFCLFTVLDAFRCLPAVQGANTAYSHGDNDFRLAALQALLLDENFRQDRRFSAARDLRPDGKEYPVHRAVALWNLEKHRDLAADRLKQALQARDLPRKPLSAAAQSLKRTFAALPGFEGSEIQRLLLIMEGWSAGSSSAIHPGSDWYTLLTSRERLDHMAGTLIQLFEATLRWEGKGMPPAACPAGLSHTDRLYASLLSAFDRLITPTLTEESGLPSSILIRLLRLGLLRVEQPPHMNTQLVYAGPHLEPPGSPKADESIFQEVWASREPRLLLLQLLEQLEQAPADPRLLLQKAPELALLLAAAPPEVPAQDEPPPSIEAARIAQLTAALANPAGLSRKDEDALTQILGQWRAVQESKKAAAALTRLLIRCRLAIWREGPSPEGLQSLDRIAALCQQRPAASAAALNCLLPPAQRPEAGMELTWLSGASAADALELALDKGRSPDQRLRWVNQAHNAGERARQKARLHGSFVQAVEYGLIRAKALALHAQLAARHEDAAAPELFDDFIRRCAAALWDAKQWLDTDLPQQLGLYAAAGCPLPDGTSERLSRELHCAAAFCDGALFADGSPVRRLLEQDARLWAAIPHGCTGPDQWDALCDVRLHTPAAEFAKAAGKPEPSAAVPVIWRKLERPAGIFLPYYCSYLDSETAVRKQYTQSCIDVYMLKTLFSLQNILLTANQITDNALIRSLAHQPGFLELLRNGHIAVSFYADFYSLPDFAARQMASPKFTWSSLPAELNSDQAARLAAARYLSGEQATPPLAFRELLIQLKEDLTLLDENLPARTKAGYYQTPNTSGASALRPAVLADHLDQFFSIRKEDPFFKDMCRLHFLLLRPGLAPDQRALLNRSLYQSALNALRNGRLDGLAPLKGFCDPEVFRPGSEQRKFSESLAGNTALLDTMQAILSGAQNRMLGSLCTRYQHHLYTEAERFIMPYSEATPINHGGCRVFQDTVTLTETGTQLGWEDVPEFITRSEALSRQYPNAPADQLAGLLSQAPLDYTVSPKGDALWVDSGVLRASTDESFLVKMSRREGTIHLETEGV